METRKENHPEDDFFMRHYFDRKNKKCGTNGINPLPEFASKSTPVTPTKKAPSGANLDNMGWDIGIEMTKF